MEILTTGLSGAEALRIRSRDWPEYDPDVAIHPIRRVLGKFLAPVSVLLEIAIVLKLALGEYVQGFDYRGTPRLQYHARVLSREPGAGDDRGAEIPACAELVLRDGVWMT